MALFLGMMRDRPFHPKRPIDLSIPKERSTFPCQKERSPLSIHKTDRPFHIAKNSQTAIALFDLFQRGDS
ncbi:hypothetical protein [Microcoleus sp. B4-C1]|uniref:hypothetical protein n=1 Tax=Microcoleus sp. B4-C1 TaxID=2818660 RepID=UPI002FD52B63